MDYTGKTIKNIYIIGRNKEDFEKYSKIGGKDPLYDCQCLLCGRLFSKRISNIRFSKRGNCGCNTLRYDLTNKRFNHLVAIRPLGLNKHGEMLWECKCDCGNLYNATSYALRTNRVSQCVKCKYQIVGEKNKRYDIYSKRLHECYVNLKTRVTNIKQDKYARYVNRGITMCDEWKNSYTSFQEWAINKI